MKPDEASVPDPCRIRSLDPARLHFRRQGAALCLRIEGDPVEYRNVSVLPSFPLSDPTRNVSVRDEKNEEIGLIPDLAALEPGVREQVAGEIRRRYLVPVILAIVSVRERFEVFEWQVETDRGPRTFNTREMRETSLRPSPERVILSDVNGNRYDIPDIRRLPPESQRLVRRWL